MAGGAATTAIDGGGGRRAVGQAARRGDRAFAAVVVALGGVVLALAGVVLIVVYRLAHPALVAIGPLEFVTGRTWDPVAEQFGALPFLYGTIVTSVIGLVLAAPVAIGLAVFVVELSTPRLRRWVSFLVELLAAIPSVVYGLWGLLVLVPVLRTTVQPTLQRLFGWAPLFEGPPIGLGYLAAGVVLAIMILPTIATVAVEVLRAVPDALREGALAIGATRWEAVRMAVLPFARRGLLGALILGLARALGETMAVTMVIGNQPSIRASLFAPGYSLPSVIANEFTEASSVMHVGALAGLALVLFGVTLALSGLARLLVRLSGGALHGASIN
jgi:phosphate transport system permease protein